MRIPMEVRGQLATRFEVLLPHLNERQQRLALAVEARPLGRGGVRAVAQVAGVSETTVRKGVVELEAGEEPFPPGRVRRPGGGRKPAVQQDPDLNDQIDAVYRDKYRRYGPSIIGGVVNPGARAATIKLAPR